MSFRLLSMPVAIGLFLTIGIYPFILVGLALCHGYLSHMNWKSWWAYALLGAFLPGAFALVRETQAWWSWRPGRDAFSVEFWRFLAVFVSSGASVSTGFWALAGVSPPTSEHSEAPAKSEN